MKDKITGWRFLVWQFGFNWLKCVSISSSWRHYWWLYRAGIWQWFVPKVGFLFWNTLQWRRKRPRSWKVQRWTHISHTTLEHLSMDTWQYAKNKQQPCRSFQNTTQSSVTKMPLSIWKLTSLFTKEEILAKKKKYNAEREDKSMSKKEKYKMLWMKDLEDKCLDTAHKIKSIICAVLPWIYTHFQCIQIFCILL